jgi:hypothetical protein
MWPVLIFLFLVIGWTLYLRKQRHNRLRPTVGHRRKNRAEVAKGNRHVQSLPMPKPNDIAENPAPLKAEIFDTPPNPKEVEIACNPSTDPEVLARLGTTKRRSIRRHVASNPNTPAPTLLQLAREFPQAVAGNPAFPKAAIFDAPPNPEEVEIASNPSTDPEVLVKLGTTHKRRSIRRHVASNPNTPVLILWKLARVFPQEVADNPMVSLLQLENPEFVLEMPYQDLVEILHTPDTPEIFINGAIGHHMSMVTTALLRNPKLSSSQLEHLVNRVNNDEMIYALLNHRHCTDSFKMTIAHGNNEPLQIGLARNCLKHETPTAESIALLEALIEHGSLAVQKFIACDTYTSDTLLDRLLAGDRQDLVYRIAWDNTPSRGLSDRLQLRLAQNQLIDLKYRISVRQILAENKVNPDILELLSRDPYAKVRASVAKRSDLPQDMLLQLAQDPAAAVQHSLIKNKSIDADRLTAMAQTSHPRMRELATQHPNTPIPILEMLVADPRLAEHLARNPNTPTATLQKIAAAGTEDIALTQNPTIPDSIVQPILAKLAIDPNYTRRKLVARHPQTPRLILTQLAQDPEPKVQRLAQQRLVK